MSDWIRCNECQPEPDTRVLIYAAIGYGKTPFAIAIAYRHDDTYYGRWVGDAEEDCWSFDEVEYWMPLPEPPKEAL